MKRSEAEASLSPSSASPTVPPKSTPLTEMRASPNKHAGWVSAPCVYAMQKSETEASLTLSSSRASLSPSSPMQIAPPRSTPPTEILAFLNSASGHAVSAGQQPTLSANIKIRRNHRRPTSIQLHSQRRAQELRAKHPTLLQRLKKRSFVYGYGAASAVLGCQAAGKSECRRRTRNKFKDKWWLRVLSEADATWTDAFALRSSVHTAKQRSQPPHVTSGGWVGNAAEEKRKKQSKVDQLWTLMQDYWRKGAAHAIAEAERRVAAHCKERGVPSFCRVHSTMQEPEVGGKSVAAETVRGVRLECFADAGAEQMAESVGGDEKTSSETNQRTGPKSSAANFSSRGQSLRPVVAGNFMRSIEFAEISAVHKTTIAKWRNSPTNEDAGNHAPASGSTMPAVGHDFKKSQQSAGDNRNVVMSEATANLMRGRAQRSQPRACGSEQRLPESSEEPSTENGNLNSTFNWTWCDAANGFDFIFELWLRVRRHYGLALFVDGGNGCLLGGANVGSEKPQCSTEALVSSGAPRGATRQCW